MRSPTCPHCYLKQWPHAAALIEAQTERGPVLRCWACGGEYQFVGATPTRLASLHRVWPATCAAHGDGECG